jgi:hypothetical protein
VLFAVLDKKGKYDTQVSTTESERKKNPREINSESWWRRERKTEGRKAPARPGGAGGATKTHWRRETLRSRQRAGVLKGVEIFY